MLDLSSIYSGVPIKRAGSIKRAGWNFHDFFQTEQDLIRASRVENWTFSLLKWYRAGQNFQKSDKRAGSNKRKQAGRM